MLQEALAETTNLQLAKQSSNALTHQKVDDDDDDDDVDHGDDDEDEDEDEDDETTTNLPACTADGAAML